MLSKSNRNITESAFYVYKCAIMRIVQAEDTLLHFQWWDRTTFALEDVSFIYFPRFVLRKRYLLVST